MAGLTFLDIIQDMNNKIDAIYRHGTLQERYSALPRDYGEGIVLTEAEAHTLGYVCKMGECTVTDLADYSFRSKGSVSKTMKHLEDKGLVTRSQRDGNKKSVYFTPTADGRHANDVHCAYDLRATSNMLSELSKVCTLEEIEGFYKVTQARIEFLWKGRIEIHK